MYYTKWYNNLYNASDTDKPLYSVLRMLDSESDDVFYLGKVMTPEYLELVGAKQSDNAIYFASYAFDVTAPCAEPLNANTLEEAKAEFEKIAIKRINQMINHASSKLSKLNKQKEAFEHKEVDINK